MKTLTPSERSALRGRAHALKPVVMIGGEGLTPAVLAEIERALKRHELIKIHVAGDDRDARVACLDQICAGTGAQPVQHIGKMLVVFRPRPEEEAAARPQKRSGRASFERTAPAGPASRAHKPIRRGLFESRKPHMPGAPADDEAAPPRKGGRFASGGRAQPSQSRGRPTTRSAHPGRGARTGRRSGH